MPHTLMVYLGKKKLGSTSPWNVPRLITHMKHLYTCLAEISSYVVIQQTKILLQNHRIKDLYKFSRVHTLTISNWKIFESQDFMDWCYHLISGDLFFRFRASVRSGLKVFQHTHSENKLCLNLSSARLKGEVLIKKVFTETKKIRTRVVIATEVITH